MASSSYDCVVIGSGPGGYVAAIRAAQLGMKTAVVEKDQVGGRCLNYACIPAKAVLRVADVLQEIRDADDFGIRVAEPEVDYDAVQQRRLKVIKTLTGGVAGLFKKNGIEVIEGQGGLTSDRNVRVGDQEIEASKCVILATGSVPKGLPGTELGGRIIGTEEAWALEQMPGRLAVVGAGASGTEIASAYARLGADVILLEMLDRVLPAEDAEVSKIAERGFKKQGIKVVTGTPVENVEGVYAIGDIVPGPALAHKASDEGIIAAEDAAGNETHPIEYPDIPRATFCTPNVGSFGLTEEQAREAGHDVVVGKLQYGAVGAGTVYGDRSGMVKIIGDKKYGELIGGHIVGTRATELIQELVNVKALEGGYSEVARIVHGHPTLSEAVMEAARAADGWLIHG
jgi:dihydrolipoamide dehydrogenase